MASIRQTKAGTWNVQIRMQGHTPSETFQTEEDAKAWAFEIESNIKKFGGVINLERLDFKTLLEMYYEKIVLVHHKGWKEEGVVMRWVLKTYPQWHTMRLEDFTVFHGQDFRDNLSHQGLVASTIRSRISFLKKAFDYAKADLRKYNLTENPFKVSLERLRPGIKRKRSLRRGEYEALREHASPRLWSHIVFSIETAIRKGEMLGITRPNVRGNKIHLPDTKNFEARTIPLSPLAREALEHIQASGGFFTTDQLRNAWEKTRKLAGCPDLHWHDLRHEGSKRLVRLGIPIPFVKSITGHKTTNVLADYAQPDEDELVDILHEALAKKAV